ncbi:MAG: CvpA family protein [Alphaproteobacteria bacterium]|nr:CvpA family protein [Alphaproteobacteria bacterium]
MDSICGIDFFIVFTLLISALLSTTRGFASEMLGLGAWFVATTLGVYLMPVLEPVSSKYISNPIISNLASCIISTILILSVLTIVFNHLTEKIKRSCLNKIDHVLGLLFGLLRGLVILVLIYFFVMTLAPKSLEQFEKESKLFVYLEKVTDNVKEQLPESLFDNPTKKLDEQDKLDALIKLLNQKKELKEKDEDKKDVKKKEAKKTSKKDKSKKQKKKKKTTEDLLMEEIEAIEKIALENQNIEDRPADSIKAGIVKTAEDLFETLNAPKVENPKKKKKGYDDTERNQLDKLFLENVD